MILIICNFWKLEILRYTRYLLIVFLKNQEQFLAAFGSFLFWKGSSNPLPRSSPRYDFFWSILIFGCIYLLLPKILFSKKKAYFALSLKNFFFPVDWLAASKFRRPHEIFWHRFSTSLFHSFFFLFLRTPIKK